jgi:hypothetical protein
MKGGLTELAFLNAITQISGLALTHSLQYFHACILPAGPTIFNEN